MSKHMDLLGQVFGCWTVVAGPNLRKGQAYWALRCQCGSTGERATGHLRSGRTRSCGCLQRTHGYSGTPTYVTWTSMVGRCTDPKHPSWKNYGARGVSVCPEWLDFKVFLADMGPRPDGQQLDREKNHLGYFKANCRWATRSVNNRNRRNNHHIEYLGKSMTIAEAAELSGIREGTLLMRIRRSPDKDPFRPVREVDHPRYKKDKS